MHFSALLIYYFRNVKKYKGYLYFLYWLLFFAIARATFLLYHFQLTRTLSGGEIFKTFLYGLRMDASFTAYICLFPFLLLLIKSFSVHLPINKIIRIYTYVLVIIISFLIIADLGLYTAWGYRMDATPLQYFKSPKIGFRGKDHGSWFIDHSRWWGFDKLFFRNPALDAGFM